MHICLLSFDLDGTFLASDKSVTLWVKEVIRLLRERGIEPVPTTERTYQTLFDRILGMSDFRYVVAPSTSACAGQHAGRSTS